jgi:hypothetical protein
MTEYDPVYFLLDSDVIPCQSNLDSYLEDSYRGDLLGEYAGLRGAAAQVTANSFYCDSKKQEGFVPASHENCLQTSKRMGSL